MTNKTSPRIQTGRSKSEQKRQNILEAASELFLHYGFEGTSMDQVAEQAGVSKQTVYSHFGNKEDLFTAIVEFKCLSHALTDELFNPNRPVEQVLSEVAKDFSDLITSNEAIQLQRACSAGAAQRSKVSLLFLEAGPKKLKAKMMRYLELQTELVIPNSRFAAQQFYSMLRGELCFCKELGIDTTDIADQLPAYLASCVTLFIRAHRR